MIKRGYRKDINEKIDYIEYLVDKLNKSNIGYFKITFDNSFPNHYLLMYNRKFYEFNTYPSVINTLEFICDLNLILY